MSDIPLPKDMQKTTPDEGGVEEHKTEIKEGPPAEKIQLQSGNTDILTVKFLEAQLAVQQGILNQLKEMNYYMSEINKKLDKDGGHSE